MHFILPASFFLQVILPLLQVATVSGRPIINTRQLQDLVTIDAVNPTNSSIVATDATVPLTDGTLGNSTTAEPVESDDTVTPDSFTAGLVSSLETPSNGGIFSKFTTLRHTGSSAGRSKRSVSFNNFFMLSPETFHSLFLLFYPHRIFGFT